MIEVKNLTKKYGSHVAVDNLTFRVEKGQIYGFLGPNGAGKSTTMNIITGYLAASSGTVTVNGKDIQKEPEAAKKCIGYLPEIPPVYADMTVSEYLKFAAELKKIPKAQRASQVEKVMEMTQITDMQKRLIKNLSKGYKQRVGLAQAILGEPQVIILDEPTVGLDPKQIIEIRDLIRNLGKEHTVILSSHILSEVSAVCDQIMIISHGKLVASDTPDGLQKLMNGAGWLEMEIKGSFDAVNSALSVIDQVATVENCGEIAGGCVKVKVTGSEPAESSKTTENDKAEENGKEAENGRSAENGETPDIREQVFYALAAAKLPILSMHYSEKSLEDIFLELTGEGISEDRAVEEDTQATDATATKEEK